MFTERLPKGPYMYTCTPSRCPRSARTICTSSRSVRGPSRLQSNWERFPFRPSVPIAVGLHFALIIPTIDIFPTCLSAAFLENATLELSGRSRLLVQRLPLDFGLLGLPHRI